MRFYPIFGEQDAGSLALLSHISIVIFDAEQVNLKRTLANFKINEVTTNQNPNPDKYCSCENTKP